MAGPKMTRKPCDGCGEAPSRYTMREAGTVCKSCQELLAEARAARERIAAGDGRYQLYATPWSFPGSLDWEVEKAFIALLQAAAVEVREPEWTHAPPEGVPRMFSRDNYPAYQIDRSGAIRDIVMVTPEFAAAVPVFWDLLRAYIDSQEKKSFRDGRRLLMSLHQGTVAPDDFDRTVLRREGED